MDSEHRFRVAYDEHVRAVAAFALRRAPTAADAEDVVSETFLVAWRRFADAPEELRPWLFGIARHVLHHHYRAGTRRDALSSRLAGALAARGPASADQGWLVHALRTLPERDRDVIALTAWEGLSHAEAGEVLGCSAGAVAVRLHRARQRLDGLRSSTPTATPALQRSDA